MRSPRKISHRSLLRAGLAEQKIVIVDSDPQHSESLATMLAEMTAAVQLVSSLDSTSTFAAAAAVLINYDALSESDRALLHDGKTLKSVATPFVICSALQNRNDLVALFDSIGLANVLARNGQFYEEDLAITLSKLLSRTIFGIEQYFPGNAQTQQFSFHASADKIQLLEQAHDFAASTNISSRLVDLYETVADELYTNAIYDAPVNQDGAARFRHIPRSKAVSLEPNENVIVTLAKDTDRLGISVSDPFGSLQPTQVIEYLSRCFRKGPDQIEQKEGGAGLGFYTTFESLSHFIINIHENKKTEVIGLIDIESSYRDFLRKGKSFNIFVER